MLFLYVVAPGGRIVRAPDGQLVSLAFVDAPPPERPLPPLHDKGRPSIGGKQV